MMGINLDDRFKAQLRNALPQEVSDETIALLSRNIISPESRVLHVSGQTSQGVILSDGTHSLQIDVFALLEVTAGILEHVLDPGKSVAASAFAYLGLLAAARRVASVVSPDEALVCELLIEQGGHVGVRSRTLALSTLTTEFNRLTPVDPEVKFSLAISELLKRETISLEGEGADRIVKLREFCSIHLSPVEPLHLFSQT
jgi:hypothetical protein